VPLLEQRGLDMAECAGCLAARLLGLSPRPEKRPSAEAQVELSPSGTDAECRGRCHRHLEEEEAVCAGGEEGETLIPA